MLLHDFAFLDSLVCSSIQRSSFCPFPPFGANTDAFGATDLTVHYRKCGWRRGVSFFTDPVKRGLFEAYISSSECDFDLLLS